MTEQYAAWIAANVADPRRTCRETTLAMAAAFPELRRVRGHYCHGLIGEAPHWWLVAPDGSIVDPTAVQFPAGGTYVEHDESQPEPTGRCLECGDYTYDRRLFCSAECHNAAAAAMNQRLR
jgi:hypothetical protein